jgi:hypothetical protein
MMSNLHPTGTAHPVIVDTAHSPHTTLRPVPLDAVVLEDSFWRPRREINRTVIIPGQQRLCEETGRIDNLRIAGGSKQGEFEGFFFNDSDVYKLLEAAAWQLAGTHDPELEAMIDGLIAVIAAAQQPNGYLNSYFMGKRAAERWTNFDLHEMYCAGHLFQAAVAHYRATGKTSLLHVATRLADHLCEHFGPEDQGKRFGTDGHPEVEMALVELYRVTGESRYLHQAHYFVGARGSGRLGNPFNFQKPVYHQDHMPFRDLSRLEGHAVRAVYLNCGGADLFAETGEAVLRTALERMWQSMVTRQMYVHAGLGPRYENEGFGRDYELPNARAHAETCASIANVMWNWRMLLLDGEARFADLLELALYNSVISGVSLDGTGYYYQNPLSDDGGHRRQTWFRVACCPGNVARTLASFPGYVYAVSDRTIWAHLYVASTATLTLPDGTTVRVEQRTEYPWSGDIHLRVLDAWNGTISLRLPGWCAAGWSVAVNGLPTEGNVTPGRYLQISRAWQAGDTIRLTLPMDVRHIECNPVVAENSRRTALMRGPLLYCLEAVDHGGADVRNVALDADAAFTAEHRSDLLGGVTVLKAVGTLMQLTTVWGDQLYRPRGEGAGVAHQTMVVTAIPYYAWANRAPGPMQMWLEERRSF